MAEPFLAEIRMMSFNYPPRGWAFCNGQVLPINQNQALFSLLGTVYGGDGRTTYGLPDLQGRVPTHTGGGGHVLGEKGGEQAHTLSISEIPIHTHSFNGTSTTGTLNLATDNILGVSQAPIYVSPQSMLALNPGSITNVGGSQAHLNMQPFLTLNFCIALQGIFPSQT
jgi:microcystin-dependent protein